MTRQATVLVAGDRMFTGGVWSMNEETGWPCIETKTGTIASGPELQWDITGVTTDGRRFKMTTISQMHALGINLYRGSVWLRVGDGPRKLIKRVYN